MPRVFSPLSPQICPWMLPPDNASRCGRHGPSSCDSMTRLIRTPHHARPGTRTFPIMEFAARDYCSQTNARTRDLSLVRPGGPEWTKSRTEADSDVTPSFGIGMVYVRTALSPLTSMPSTKLRIRALRSGSGRCTSLRLPRTASREGRPLHNRHSRTHPPSFPRKRESRVGPQAGGVCFTLPTAPSTGSYARVSESGNPRGAARRGHPPTKPSRQRPTGSYAKVSRCSRPTGHSWRPGRRWACRTCRT